MDDVGRLCQGLALVAIVAIVMGFFTLCGNAILQLSESKLEQLEYRGEGNAKKAKKRKYEKIRRLQRDSDVIVQTNLFVRTAAIILPAAFGRRFCTLPLNSIVYSHFDGNTARTVYVICVVIAAAVAAVIFSAVGVSLPKKLCLGGKTDERFVSASFGLYNLFLTVFKPAQLTVSLLSSALARLFGVKNTLKTEQITEAEILQMLDAANENGGIEDEQAEMISNIFEFSDLEIHEVMTHRTEIMAVEENAPVTEAVKVSVETGVSRIPIYKNTIDNICGVIYIKDLLPLILQPDTQTRPVSEYSHGIKYVPETSSCGELFRYFTENKKQIAVALDEYGGTAGIVTMEDLLECIVGNIRDEYDENEAEEIEEITPNTFDILGGADPDDAMERLGHKLEDGHGYDTMGGFITALLGYIPSDGETPTVRWKDITFGVISAKDNRIEKLMAIKDHKKAAVFDED